MTRTNALRDRNRAPALTLAAAGVLFIVAATGGARVAAQDGSASLMSRAFGASPIQDDGGTPHALLDASLFAIAPPELRTFYKHDLIQIIVREASRAESTQELDTEKIYNLRGKVGAWPDLQLEDLLQLRLFAGRTDMLPEVKIDLGKNFEGEGDYTREDEMATRITAEVIDVLPNGNLVLEARTHIKTDEEESLITVTGVCRPVDVTAVNTVLSSQIHSLDIKKVNKGELKKANTKGIISKFFDFLFAW